MLEITMLLYLQQMIQCTLQFNITFLIHPSISSIPGATSRLPAWMSGWSTAPTTQDPLSFPKGWAVIWVESDSLQQQCFFYLLPSIHAFWKRTLKKDHSPIWKVTFRGFQQFSELSWEPTYLLPTRICSFPGGMRPYVRSFVGWALHR